MAAMESGRLSSADATSTSTDTESRASEHSEESVQSSTTQTESESAPPPPPNIIANPQAIEEFRKQAIREDIIAYQLKKESRAVRRNETHFLSTWRHKMRFEKGKELRKEIKVFQAVFERIYDRKCAQLATLQTWNAQSEVQRAQSSSLHYALMDRLQYIQDLRMNDLKRTFNEEITFDKTDMDERLMTMNNLLEKQLQEMLEIFLSMDTNFSQIMFQKQINFHEMAGEENARLTFNKQTMRCYLEAWVRKLWSEYREEQHNYETITRGLSDQLEYYKMSERRLEKELYAYQRRIDVLEYKIAAARHMLLHGMEDFQAHRGDIKTSVTVNLENTSELRQRMRNMVTDHDAHIKHLLSHVNYSRLRMLHLLRVSERILRCAERLRRFQTEEEKLLPFQEMLVIPEVPSTSPSDFVDPDTYGGTCNANVEIDTTELSKLSDTPSDDVESYNTLKEAEKDAIQKEAECMAYFREESEKQEPLKKFWDRMARAKFDCLVLWRTRDILTQENLDLKKTLSNFLRQISSHQKR